MSKKKHSVLGMAALAAAGAGAAVLANKSREEKQITEAHVDPNYRNTERGKNEKNSKGISSLGNSRASISSGKQSRS